MLMNVWTKLLLHLRRAKLRQSFVRQWPELHDAFKQALLAQNRDYPGRQWQDVEWISEPVLHVLPDTQSIPVALVGMAAMYEITDDHESSNVQTQAGTAVFYFEQNAWTTQGKLLLNLSPSEALLQLQRQATSAPV